MQIGNMYRSQKPSKKLQMCQYSATLENLTFDMKITAKCCFIIVSKTNQNRIDELQNAYFIQYPVHKVQMFVMANFFLLYLKVCNVKNL